MPRLTSAYRLDFQACVNNDNAMSYETCMNSMKKRRPYLTRQGYVGLGPIDIQAGDVICILFGGKVPYVLRPFYGEGGYQRYAFVGEAYCDGIMDGEFMETNFEEQTFIIC